MFFRVLVMLRSSIVEDSVEYLIGKQIGAGGTSTVYEWGNHEVIKIFKPHMSEDAITYEEYIGTILNKFALEIPRFIRSIEMDGKKALIYERVNGSVLLDSIFEGGGQPDMAYRYAKMHHDIHRCSITELPSQYEFLKRRVVEMKPALGDKAEKLLDLLDSIPDDIKLCHGDYQPLNILTCNGKYIAIDWNDACFGNPVLDVAWSYQTLNSPAIRFHFDETVANLAIALSREYLMHYSKLSGIDEGQIIRCLPIVAARRLYDNNLNENDISRWEHDWLMDNIAKA